MKMDVFTLMKKKGVEFLPGLSFDEIEVIEKVYGIKFPYSLKCLFIEGLPISTGFYHWNDFSESNINMIKSSILAPFSYISEHIEELEWLNGGDFPTAREKLEYSYHELNNAPRLIPLYGHRYIPMIDLDDPPILSVHGFDIICYGITLLEWAEIEFRHKKTLRYSIGEIPFIPFWSEIC